jgi:hypothetical protein
LEDLELSNTFETQPAPCPSPIVMQIWNSCRGLDWNALPVMFELYGVEDIDVTVHELLAIKKFVEDKNG